jgi:hypothetical protein
MDALVDALGGLMERLSQSGWPSCSAVERHYPSSHCGEFCGRMMCMLWIGGLDENFVIALF